MGEGNGRLRSSQDKSSGNVLGVFYRLLPMVRKDATFGGEVSKGVDKHENQTLRRDVRGTTDLQKVCCALIRHLFFYAFD